MGTIQLVEAPNSAGRRVIEYRDNPDSSSYLRFEHGDVHAVLWSSVDLVRIAARLSRSGFRVRRILITDGQLQEVEGDVAEAASRMLNAGDADAVLDLLNDDVVPAFVQTITLSNRREHAEFQLRQNGGVSLIGATEPQSLLTALSST